MDGIFQKGKGPHPNAKASQAKTERCVLSADVHLFNNPYRPELSISSVSEWYLQVGTKKMTNSQTRFLFVVFYCFRIPPFFFFLESPFL